MSDGAASWALTGHCGIVPSRHHSFSLYESSRFLHLFNARFRKFLLALGADALGPFTLVPTILAFVAFATSPHPWLAFGIAVVFTTLIPLLTSVGLLRTGRSTNRYIVNRSQRHTFYAISVASVVTGVVLLMILPVGMPMRWGIMMMLISLIAAALINMKLKVSLHALVASTAALLIPALTAWPVLLITVPLWLLVAWARVADHQHSPQEVALGSAMGLIASMTYIAFLLP